MPAIWGKEERETQILPLMGSKLWGIYTHVQERG